jgi:spermidine/putrescine transport system permease protein
VFSSGIANGVEDRLGIELEALRPGLVLPVLGPFSFIATIATLVISRGCRGPTARSKRRRSIRAAAGSG